MKDTIIIGTRGSALALKQTEIIKSKLLNLSPSLKIEVKIITTKGDTNLSPIPLDTVGKGWFTKELDEELLNERIDLSVHSLKDIEIIPKGLLIAGIPEREDARDVLISNGIVFEYLKPHAIIGTDSSRRKSQILHKRSDVIVKSLRGNVDTRIRKVKEGEYDAIILAAAGLKRLGLANSITQYFNPTDVVPSPGQGALAVVIRKGDAALEKLVKQLDHPATVCAVTAERTFSSETDGGCNTPIGAYAVCDGATITIYGMIGSLDGTSIAKDAITESCSDANKAAEQLAKKLLQQSKKFL